LALTQSELVAGKQGSGRRLRLHFSPFPFPFPFPFSVYGKANLAGGARLRVASLSGAQSATRASVGQLHTGALMPFAFMQSQPGLMLAALGQALGWQGDASFVVGRDAPELLLLTPTEN